MKMSTADLWTAPIVLKSSVFDKVCWGQTGLQLLQSANALNHGKEGV
jgi:hypothetical protein